MVEKEGRAKAIRLADMACIVDADIYIHSHTHLPMIMKVVLPFIEQTHQTVHIDALISCLLIRLQHLTMVDMARYMSLNRQVKIIQLYI